MSEVTLFTHQALPLRFPEVELETGRLIKAWSHDNQFQHTYTDQLLADFHLYIKDDVHIEDLEHFKPRVSFGTIGAFQDFVLLNQNKLQFGLAGEFSYHSQLQLALKNEVLPWPTEAPSRPSFLILSQPFAGDGCLLEAFDQLLTDCDRWGVDVLLDLAFWGTHRLPVTVRKHKCVKAISFSLSKLFNLGNYRIGVTYWRYDHVPADVVHDWTYVNHFHSFLALGLLKRFPSSYLRQRAQLVQSQICESHDLVPADCVMFGNSDHEKWSAYARAPGKARVCLSPLLNRELENGQNDNP